MSRAPAKRSQRARASLGWIVLAMIFGAGCARPDAQRRSEPGPEAGSSEIAQAASALLATPCERALPSPAIPLAVAAPRAPGSYDVALYVAHPDDEAMYAGGTLARLERAGRRAAVVMMSHGEGGRVLERTDGGIVARRDLPRTEVAALRDDEARRALAVVAITPAHLYDAAANADFGKTTSCEETLRRWDATLPGGLAGALARLVDDIRTRRPRVVITLDPRDDPEASRHGHHRAVGVLVELAARLAADARVPGTPHVVDETLACAPKDAAGDVTIEVDPEVRLAMLRAYASQFDASAFGDVARRPREAFVLRWRARGAAPGARSLLDELVAPQPAPRDSGP